MKAYKGGIDHSITRIHSVFMVDYYALFPIFPIRWLNK